MMINAAEYNALGLQIIDIIKFYCSFPGPILKTQCRRLNKEPDAITKDDLKDLAEWIGKSVGNFTNPVKGKAVRDEILHLQNITK